MPHVVYNPKIAQPPPGAPATWAPPDELHAIAEGIRFSFPAFKAKQVSDEQWRLFNTKLPPGSGLSLLSVDDDMVAEILERRASALGTREAAPAPIAAAEAPAPASAPGSQAAPPAATLVEQAVAIHNFPKLAGFARKHLGHKDVPRTREGILAALALLDGPAARGPSEG